MHALYSRLTLLLIIISNIVSFGSSYWTGQRNTGNITLYNVTCSELSSDLVQDCSFNTVTGYQAARCRELIVKCHKVSNCTEGDIRLVDGNSTMEGRVEVCIQGVWGFITKSRSYRNRNIARVACRQLGYPWECELQCVL